MRRKVEFSRIKCSIARKCDPIANSSGDYGIRNTYWTGSFHKNVYLTFKKAKKLAFLEIWGWNSIWSPLVKLQKLTKDLQFDSTEEIGEFADRVSQINQKILDSTEAGLRFAEVIKFLPETSKRYLLQINELNEDCFQNSVLLLANQNSVWFLTNEKTSFWKPSKKFKKINIRLEESKNFINEPSKLILQELSSKIEHQKEQSENVLGKLIELTNRTGQGSPNAQTIGYKSGRTVEVELDLTDSDIVRWTLKGPLDEAKLLSESTSIYQQASRDHEKTQKLIHTITTLNNECQIDMKESDLSFYFAKHTFKLRFQNHSMTLFCAHQEQLSCAISWW